MNVLHYSQVIYLNLSYFLIHQSFVQVLEPMIVQNEARKITVFLQCLKCMKVFPKDQAKKRVEKKAKKSGTWTSEEESGSGELRN